MTDFVILGTDTDAGKTTLALLWLAGFPDDYEYWKPLETGESDTERLRRLVPAAHMHPPLCRFGHAVAPLLAARMEDATVPAASAIAAAKPPLHGRRRCLVVETFGSPFSPLNDTQLQVALIQELTLPSVLVTSSAVGAIGRVLQTVQALRSHRIEPRSIVLIGEPDRFAVEQIARHASTSRVFALRAPTAWNVNGVARAAREQAAVLETMRHSLVSPAHRITASQELLDLDKHCVWHPYTSLQEADPPLLSVAAQAEYLWLADGRRVIDAISSWWTILHGHRYPVLMAALREAAESFDHVQFAGVTHPPAIELADLLLRTISWGRPSSPDQDLSGKSSGGRVFYSDNGSTAVEVALKMAYQYWCHQGEPQRTWFIGFTDSYHGDTFGAMAVSRDPVFFGRFEPLLFRAEIAPLVPERLDDVLTRHPGEVAAVILEPLVQGAGGMRMHSPSTLRALAEVVRRHGVLLIVDEVMTGGGRTGSLWAHQAAGIVPDLICAAKTLAGGVLPLAATLAAPHLVAAWQTADRSRTFFHGHSFTAHPLACAVAVANWRMLTAAPNSVPKQMEAFWSEKLAPLRSDPRVREVRICGTIAAVELNAAGGYLAEVGRQLRRYGLERCVLLRPLGSVLYAMPPFCTSQNSLEQVADAMLGAVRSLGLG
jgi:adenosylmethionine-8-amino-7-oxononanoate aminotransferase